jgi:hypothetical protein
LGVYLSLISIKKADFGFSVGSVFADDSSKRWRVVETKSNCVILQSLYLNNPKTMGIKPSRLLKSFTQLN